MIALSHAARPPKCLAQSLNDFLDLHSEELRLELRGAGSTPVFGEEKEGGELKQGKHRQGMSEVVERVEDREFSQRVHSIYQEFLAVVQGNLEGGGCPSFCHEDCLYATCSCLRA